MATDTKITSSDTRKGGKGTALDEAFAALESYEYGGSRAALLPIDEAVREKRQNAEERKALEARLCAALEKDISPIAKRYVCRKLELIGSAEAVPALAYLLDDEDVSVLARSALERIPGPEVSRALRRGLRDVDGPLKVGVIQSLGARRDPRSVRALAGLLRADDVAVAGVAAEALGRIGTVRAGRALCEFLPEAPERTVLVVADACLVCAERLSARGRTEDARAIYEALAGSSLPKHVKVAASKTQE